MIDQVDDLTKEINSEIKRLKIKNRMMHNFITHASTLPCANEKVLHYCTNREAKRLLKKLEMVK